MKIAQVNLTCKYGSTGKIVNDLESIITNSGDECVIVSAYAKEKKENIFQTQSLSYFLATRKDILISRLTGKMGYRSKLNTKKAIKWLKIQKPDIVHLHNIHGDWINIKMLFEYIKSEKLPVVWTLHDCWAFTGRCSHFEKLKCEQWKNQCSKCPSMSAYPISYFFDHSKKMHKDKKEWFSYIERVTLVTPSKWLANYVKESFLGCYPIQVINNGIDTSKYCPQIEKNEFIKRYSDKKIILGVASSWSTRKGLIDFYELDKIIDHNVYKIILIGLNSRQLKNTPDTIYGIARTDNEEELIRIYSQADVFVNPTYEDNYPTTNLEAISCGTPVITYRTGGSIESVQNSEMIVEQGDIAGLYSAIERVCKLNVNQEELHKYACENFDKYKKFSEYLKLYKNIFNNNI